MAEDLSREELRTRAIQLETEAILALALLPTPHIEPTTLSPPLVRTWLRDTASALARHTTLATEDEIVRDTQLLDRAQWLAKHAAYRQTIAGVGQPQSSCWTDPSKAAGTGSLLDEVNRSIQANGFDHDALLQQALSLRNQARSVLFDSFPDEEQPVVVIDNLGRNHEPGSMPPQKELATLVESQMRHAQLIGSPWLRGAIAEGHQESLVNTDCTAEMRLITIGALRRVDARLRAQWACAEMKIQGVAGISPDEPEGALYAVLSREDPAFAAPVLDWVWREGPDKVPTSGELNHVDAARTWWSAVGEASRTDGLSRA